ncbi:MAG: hypothetical protein Rhirs2KO_13880 [Rhizobiaceae bacterium]
MSMSEQPDEQNMNNDPSGRVPSVSVIMPVRNEPVSLEYMLRLLPALVDFDYEIVVVVDTMADTSIAAVEAASEQNPHIRLVLNDLGKGAMNAVRAGIQAAECDYVMLFAADEIGPVFIINQMHELMMRGCDMVSCTRYAWGGARLGGSAIGGALSRMANYLLNKVIGTCLTDLTTGIKMIRRDKAIAFEFECQPVGWAFALELAVKAEYDGWKLGEVPLISVDRMFGGESSFRVGSWTVEYFRWFRWAATHRSRAADCKAEVLVPHIKGVGQPPAVT